MNERILVGYDRSDSAKACLEFALQLAQLADGHVYVLYVIPTSQAGSEACASMMTDDHDRIVQELEADVADLGVGDASRVTCEVAYGSPGDVLLDRVRRHDIGHIVMGHTERGALLRWLLGSVSTDVIARSRVPVTVIP